MSAVMDPVRTGQGRKVQYVVLNRAHAGLYSDMVSLFSACPDVVVIVDRRRSQRTPRHEQLDARPAPSSADGRWAT